MSFSTKLVNIFSRIAHDLGFNAERSRTTRVASILPFEKLADTKAVTQPSTIRYFFKLYPDFDGQKGKLSMLFEGGGLGVPRWMVTTQGGAMEEAYCHSIDIGRFNVDTARSYIADFDGGKKLDDILPYDAFDYALINAVCESEAQNGPNPPRAINPFIKIFA